MKFNKKPIIFAGMTDIQLAKELIDNTEFTKRLTFRKSEHGSGGYFFEFDSGDWKCKSSRDLRNELIQMAYGESWACSAKELSSALDLFPVLLEEYSEGYPQSEIDMTISFVIEELIKPDKNSSINIGSYLRYKEIETVRQLQEFGKGGLLQCCLAAHHLAEDLERPNLFYSRHAFAIKFTELFQKHFKVSLDLDDFYKNGLKGYSLKTDAFPFVVDEDALLLARGIFKERYGLYCGNP